MNMNLSLNLSPESLKALLPKVLKVLPSLFGLALVALFAYTAYFLNQQINVQPLASQTTLSALPKVTFNKNVISSLQNRDVVNGSVPVNLGTNDPFQ